MDEEEQQKRDLVTRSVQLAPEQWKWLDALARRNYSRSAAAELRKIVADAMEREREAVTV